MNRHSIIHRLSTVLLGPLLLKQGKMVRQQTIRLPEPEGKRQGVTGNGSALRLLILGDSAAAGVGAGHQSEALSGQLVAELSKTYRLEWQLLAETGWRTRDVSQAIEQLAGQPFDLIVTSIGVNDVTANLSLSQWQNQQQALIAKLHDKFSPQRILLSAVPPMERFTAMPQPLRWYVGNRAAQFNQVLRNALSAESRCTFVQVDAEQSADHLAADGFHPSPIAYQLWAEQLVHTFAQSN